MSDTVKAWIEERRAAMDEATEALTPDGYKPDFLGLPRALSALETVLELHFKHGEQGGIEWCWECDKTWPCATIQTIERAINDE